MSFSGAPVFCEDSILEKRASGASGGVHLVAYADDLQNVSLEP
eukprot:s8645_g1.t1